ncbi:four helix bundle protein [bacterium]|nr:four helix bundle protein [bacterium]PIU90109.1 MAG: four helix bundle protein [Anaerolineae bacterium CG06_land_8_20_14_3_00_57_67]PIW17404.1 MAG: four helix bundle protein [Anaerolineae bacterium CG17_big_fil_post_rev_8_21_14_2_50_57_27]PJH75459.1 MAG: four helix bundle protein [Anaerolineae bacterium CG_4_9_14_0_8_um_filter_58_9]
MDELSFEEWQKAVPVWMKSDPLWESGYYRMAMYLYDLVWQDCDLLKKDYRGREIVSQIIRSAGGIGANMEEAYGRGVGTPDYVRVMRISLGEARETRGWYFRSRQLLPEDLLKRRAALTGQLIAMIAGVISAHRKNLGKH